MSSGSSEATPPARPDNRRPTDLRPIHISYDSLARVDGSARFSFGQSTTSLASLSGPIEVRLAAELPSKATFEVLVRPLSGIPATEAKALAAILRACLEPSLILTRNPRTLVQLVVQGLGSSSSSSASSSVPSSSSSSAVSPGLTTSMINASSLSLLVASSIPMRGVVCAVSVGLRDDGTLILDPSEEEVAAGSLSGGAGAFAFMITTADDGSRARAGASGNGNGNGDTKTSRYKSDCVWSSWKSKSTKGGRPSPSPSPSDASSSELLLAREMARIGAEGVYAAMRRSFEERVGVRTGAGVRDVLVVKQKMKLKHKPKKDDDEVGSEEEVMEEEEEEDKMEI